MKRSHSILGQLNAIAKSLPKPIIVVLSVFLIVKISILTLKVHVPGWDESVYLGLGKYIYSSGKIGLFEDIRPLGLPFILGLFSRTQYYILISDLIMLLFSLAAILMTYLVARKLFDEKVALISSIILAATPVFFFQSHTIMTEIPAAFFGLLAVYLYLKDRFMLSGAFSAVAFMFRYHLGLMLVCLLIASSWRWKRSVRILKGFLIVTVPVLIFNFFFYGKFFYPYLIALTHGSNPNYLVEDKIKDLIFYPFELVKDFPVYLFIIPALLLFCSSLRKNEQFIWAALLLVSLAVGLFVYLPVFLLVALAFSVRLASKNTSLLIICASIFMLYLTHLMNKQLRFIVIALPFIAILSAFGLYSTLTRLKGRHILIASVIVFIFISSAFALRKDMVSTGYYFWEEPEIVRDFYTYLTVNGIQGPVLTMDPVPAVYNNLLFVPFYDTITETITKKNRRYDQEHYNAFILNPEVLVCPDDYLGVSAQECIAARTALMQRIIEENELIYQGTFWGRTYYILVS